jgi:GMP synthase-like glutamine amidotransferase
MAGQILVFEHHDGGGADALGAKLVGAGFELAAIALDRGDAIPDLARFDALVVLGGEMNVWQEDSHNWLVAEKAAIRDWVAGPPKPLLGICLGHQLLADALGGEVGLGARFEAGIHPVRLTAEGGADPVLGGLTPTFGALQWHGAEVRRVPDGAVVLATNDTCAVQAMRVGACAWGVQFHPEVSLVKATEWGEQPTFRALLDAFAGAGAAGRYPAALEAEYEAMAATTATLARAFAARMDPLRTHQT